MEVLTTRMPYTWVIVTYLNTIPVPLTPTPISIKQVRRSTLPQVVE